MNSDIVRSFSNLSQQAPLYQRNRPPRGGSGSNFTVESPFKLIGMQALSDAGSPMNYQDFGSCPPGLLLPHPLSLYGPLVSDLDGPEEPASTPSFHRFAQAQTR